jgi:hypothetical protein
MTVMMTLEGETYDARARKSTAHTGKDQIQLQILDHQLRYYGFQQPGASGSE